MGSFSFTCQLSGLPITSGEKAVIIPIIPKDHWWDNSEKSLRKFGQVHFCSNDGENIFFEELCFPIFGEYNDYGSMENIIHDDNIKVLEEFFELSIEDIIEVLTDGRKDEYLEGGQFCDSVKILKKDNPKHMLLLRTSCTWIHGDLYERLAKYEGKRGYFDRLDLGVDGILTSLGFVLTKELSRKINSDSEKNRYYKIYEKDGLTLKSDGNWIDVSLKENIYSIFDLEKYCNKKGVKIDISDYVKKGMWEQVYDYILPKINDLQDHDRWTTERVIRMLIGDEYKVHMMNHGTVLSELKNTIEKIKKESEEKGEKIPEQVLKLETEMLENLDESEDEIEVDNITVFYFNKIKELGNDFMKKNIIDWHKVKSYYYPTGRYLYPIGTSPQDGDHKKVKQFLEICLESINETLKDVDRFGPEEDEEE